MTYFTIPELCKSQTAVRKGINNTPPLVAKSFLISLIDNILVPVRTHFDAPVIVTSGYRSPELNRAIGGSSSSQHCLGQAADFTVHGVDDLTVARWIEENLDFDQLILEFPPQGWIHCSWRATDRRGQVLTAKKQKGKTVYINGLKP